MSDDNENDITPPRPLFLQASRPDTWEKPDDTTWGDHFLNPARPLNARHRLLAKMVAEGCTTTEIAAKLKYTEARVSVLKSNTRILQLIEQIQDRMFEDDIEKRMKSLGPDALNAIEEILTSDKIDAIKKETSARWLLEKLTGKPAQQIDIKGEITVGHFLDELDKIKSMREVSARQPTPSTEITGTADVELPVLDPITTWLDDNI